LHVMRAELFVKDAASLLSSARLLFHVGATGINLPNKAKTDLPVAALQTLAGALAPSQMAEVCPHYSLKFNAERSADVALSRFETFCEHVQRLGVRRVLLVSGSGSRKFDTVACLTAMTLPSERCPRIGVAFNPYLPTCDGREKERERLRQKLATGRVSSVWLQIGSDQGLLAEGLSFLRSIASERGQELELHGSVFLPSKLLLAQMKFRPWNGVFLSDEYLSSVEAAEAISLQVLGLYRAHNVQVLIETAIRTPAEWQRAECLVHSSSDRDSPHDLTPLPPRDIISRAAESSGGGLVNYLRTESPPSSAAADRGRASGGEHGAGGARVTTSKRRRPLPTTAPGASSTHPACRGKLASS
jgi:hypothetical protein